jgi:hypothetical protein
MPAVFLPYFSFSASDSAVRLNASRALVELIMSYARW